MFEATRETSAPDLALIADINASDMRPVVFVHLHWLLRSSWDRWAKMFEEAGYAVLAPGWPDEPETVVGSRSASRHSPRRLECTNSSPEVAFTTTCVRTSSAL
jgi:hypothetical protein